MSVDLKVCFVLDFHKPMDNCIPSIKNQVEDIIAEVKKHHPMKTIEVAFIGYGGYFCVPYTVNCKFTKDIKGLQQKLNTTERTLCTPSDCRNIQQAYGLVNDLEWYAKRKIIFHMGNGPPFGPKYHDKTVCDPYPPGHPYLVLEEEVEKFAMKNIDLVLFQLSTNWDKMVKVIESHYLSRRREGFHVVDVIKTWALCDVVYEKSVEHILRQFVQRIG